MFWKIALTLGLLVVVWALLFRSAGPLLKSRPRKSRNPQKRTLKSQDLVKCRTCGIYLPAGQPCGCKDRA